MKNLEYRSVDLQDVAVDAPKRTIEGRAVVYNSLSVPMKTVSGDTFRELIMPGALAESMVGNDILAYKEHNPQMLLGRRSSGTLVLEDRVDGLYVRIDVPNTTYGNDLIVSAERGDIKGFSFGFNNPKARNYSRSGEKIREITSLNLREVSIVSSPAYTETTMTLRNEEFVEEDKREEVVEKKEEAVVTEVATEVETKSEEQSAVDLLKAKNYELKQKFYTLNGADPGK